VANAQYGEVQASLFVAGAAFGEVQVSLFVAGAAFGEVQSSLFVAGAIFGEVGVSFFVAGAIFCETLFGSLGQRCFFFCGKCSWPPRKIPSGAGRVADCWFHSRITLGSCPRANDVSPVHGNLSPQNFSFWK